MRFIFTVHLVCLSTFLFAQITFNTHRLHQEKSATVHAAEIEEVYQPVIRYLEPVFPGGQIRKMDLEEKKKWIAQKYPRTSRNSVAPRNEGAPLPEIINSFEGNIGNGFPSDNYVAVSEEGQILSIVNFNFAVYDQNGSLLLYRNINDFTTTLPDNEFRYDPKVLYDPVSDRFIMVMVSGFECSNSSVVVAFSQTNDATGSWNLYQIEGCPLDDGTWADYPMITQTDSEFILTLNQIEDSGTWQNNFEQSLIWRIAKESGYAGEDLDIQLFSDIEYNGQRIRNLCPVKNGLDTPGEGIYFLSNKPFDIQNDSIWILELKDIPMDSTPTLNITVSKSDTPYGVPPNARQPGGILQTNDARILDAVNVEDWIQFVFTSIDTLTGNAAIYHGLINNLHDTRDISGQLYSSDTEYAYPSISFTGGSPDESNVIISASHSSDTRYPGLSCLYVDSNGNCSDWLTIKEGEGTITTFSSIRWGDYTASQRLATPGHVFVTSSFGRSDNNYGTYLAEIAAPELSTGSTPLIDRSNVTVKSFPNPTQDKVTIQFFTQSLAQQKIALYDFQGRLIKVFQDGKPKKAGRTEFIFSTESLAKGVYFLMVVGDNQILANETIVVN